MKFILSLLLIGVVAYCLVCCSAQTTTCDYQTVGGKSKVLCLSKTHFKINPTDKDALECPPGTVCADAPEICSTKLNTALCKNTVIGSKGTCNECRNNDVNKVCISDTEYSLCSGGKVMPAFNYTCEEAKPFCKATIDDTTGAVTAICQAKNDKLDCPSSEPGTTAAPSTTTEDTTPSTAATTAATTPAPTTDPTTPRPTPPLSGFTCTANGLFSDPADTTCTKYIKCTKDQSGNFVSGKFQCVGTGYVFNPLMQRCELAANFNCKAA